MPFPLNQWKSFQFISRSCGTGFSGLLGREEFTSIISLSNKSSYTGRKARVVPFHSIAAQDLPKCGSAGDGEKTGPDIPTLQVYH